MRARKCMAVRSLFPNALESKHTNKGGESLCTSRSNFCHKKGFIVYRVRAVLSLFCIIISQTVHSSPECNFGHKKKEFFACRVTVSISFSLLHYLRRLYTSALMPQLAVKQLLLSILSAYKLQQTICDVLKLPSSNSTKFSTMITA